MTESMSTYIYVMLKHEIHVSELWIERIFFLFKCTTLAIMRATSCSSKKGLNSTRIMTSMIPVQCLTSYQANWELVVYVGQMGLLN